MRVNELPAYDARDKSTGCCARFDPAGWDRQELNFDAKRFVRARTRSLFHIPINMRSVFRKTFAAIEAAAARSDRDFIVLSMELSPWAAEHYFAVTKDVPGQDMVRLSGDFLTRVFEGPYRDMPQWRRDLASYAAERDKRVDRTFFFYTTCPGCARVYGKNYVVGAAQVSRASASGARASPA
jgi:hydrolase family protein